MSYDESLDWALEERALRKRLGFWKRFRIWRASRPKIVPTPGIEHVTILDPKKLLEETVMVELRAIDVINILSFVRTELQISKMPPAILDECLDLKGKMEGALKALHGRKRS